MLFATAVVVTGPVWATPVWGRAWNWEPRLLTFTVMWFAYAGYLVLRGGLAGQGRQRVVCAVYALLASVTTPLVYFSVRLVAEEHQQHPRSIGLSAQQRQVLYLTLLGLTALWVALLLMRRWLADLSAAIDDQRAAFDA
jgi:heme exporter protein C